MATAPPGGTHGSACSMNAQSDLDLEKSEVLPHGSEDVVASLLGSSPYVAHLYIFMWQSSIHDTNPLDSFLTFPGENIV